MLLAASPHRARAGHVPHQVRPGADALSLTTSTGRRGRRVRGALDRSRRHCVGTAAGFGPRSGPGCCSSPRSARLRLLRADVGRPPDLAVRVSLLLGTNRCGRPVGIPRALAPAACWVEAPGAIQRRTASPGPSPTVLRAHIVRCRAEADPGRRGPADGHNLARRGEERAERGEDSSPATHAARSPGRAHAVASAPVESTANTATAGAQLDRGGARSASAPRTT